MKLLLLSLLSILAASNGNANDECPAPPPFNQITDTSGPKPSIHVIMSITTGDYFTQLLEGARLQAQLIGGEDGDGVDVIVTSSDGDDAKQAQLVLEAARGGSDVVGILTVDGHADSMCGAINSVLDTTNDIQIVSFDFDGSACSSAHILASQADDEMASLVLDEAVKEQGKDINVGYVNDLNYAPLMNRNNVWEAYKDENNWNELFFVENAANYSSAADLQTGIEQALVKIMEEGGEAVDFIYAPWDYLSINTVKAIEAVAAATNTNTSVDVSVYGADVNNEDIAIMTNSGSPWKATAGGNPRAIGAALIRMVAMASANELNNETTTQIKIPSTLITQEFLLENNVSNMMELDGAMPELTLPGFMQVCWIKPAVDVGQMIGTSSRTPSASPTKKVTTPMPTGSTNNETSSTAYVAVSPIIMTTSPLMFVVLALASSWLF